MDDETIVARLRTSGAAFANGDITGVLENFAENVEFVVPGKNPIAGSYRGHDGFTAFVTRLVEAIGTMPDVRIENVLASAGQSVQFYVIDVPADPTPERLNVAIFNQHADDGKITKTWFLPDRQAVADRLMS